MCEEHLRALLEESNEKDPTAIIVLAIFVFAVIALISSSSFVKQVAVSFTLTARNGTNRVRKIQPDLGKGI
jgi:hypothetical protein